MEQLAKYHPALPDIAVVLILLLTSYLAYFVASRLGLAVLRSHGKRSASAWNRALINNCVGEKLAQLLPVAVILRGSDLLPGIDEEMEDYVLNLTSAYLFGLAALTTVAILSAVNEIYESNPEARQRPIKAAL